MEDTVFKQFFYYTYIVGTYKNISYGIKKIFYFKRPADML